MGGRVTLEWWVIGCPPALFIHMSLNLWEQPVRFPRAWPLQPKPALTQADEHTPSEEFPGPGAPPTLYSPLSCSTVSWGQAGFPGTRSVPIQPSHRNRKTLAFDLLTNQSKIHPESRMGSWAFARYPPACKTMRDAEGCSVCGPESSCVTNGLPPIPGESALSVGLVSLRIFLKLSEALLFQMGHSFHKYPSMQAIGSM